MKLQREEKFIIIYYILMILKSEYKIKTSPLSVSRELNITLHKVHQGLQYRILVSFITVFVLGKPIK